MRLKLTIGFVLAMSLKAQHEVIGYDAIPALSRGLEPVHFTIYQSARIGPLLGVSIGPPARPEVSPNQETPSFSLDI